jgi:hypothetical protein
LEYDFLCLQIKLAAFMCNFNFFGKNRTEPELTEGITKTSLLFGNPYKHTASAIIRLLNK